MNRYLFEYEIPSTKQAGTFSWTAKTEEEAREKVQAKVADFEFIETNEVIVGKLIEVKETTGNQYYECEGCSA
jgi:capsid portal protein